jgi:hypothetical protein
MALNRPRAARTVVELPGQHVSAAPLAGPAVPPSLRPTLSVR